MSLPDNSPHKEDAGQRVSASYETNPTIWEDRLGQDGEELIRVAAELYSYNSHHRWLTRMFNGDWFSSPLVAPLAIRWGIVAHQTITDKSFAIIRRSMEESSQVSEHVTWMFSGGYVWAMYLYTTGIEYGREQLLALLVECGVGCRP